MNDDNLPALPESFFPEADMRFVFEIGDWCVPLTIENVKALRDGLDHIGANGPGSSQRIEVGHGAALVMRGIEDGAEIEFLDDNQATGSKTLTPYPHIFAVTANLTRVLA